MTATDDPARRQQRLAWRCRRGMQELDILLGRFLEQQFQTLDARGQQAFEDLLALEDDQLWDWLSGRVPCPEERFSRLVAQMRSG